MSGCFDLEQVDLWFLQLENGKNPTLLHQIIGADMHRLEGLFTGLEAQLGERSVRIQPPAHLRRLTPQTPVSCVSQHRAGPGTTPRNGSSVQTIALWCPNQFLGMSRSFGLLRCFSSVVWARGGAGSCGVRAGPELRRKVRRSVTRAPGVATLLGRWTASHTGILSANRWDEVD